MRSVVICAKGMATGHLRQGNGDLAVLQAGRTEDETDGDIAVDHVQMGLVPTPAFGLILAVLLAASVANCGQIGQIRLRLGRSLLASVNRGGVAADVSGELLTIVPTPLF